jgi:hypothetical protein
MLGICLEAPFGFLRDGWDVDDNEIELQLAPNILPLQHWRWRKERGTLKRGGSYLKR